MKKLIPIIILLLYFTSCTQPSSDSTNNGGGGGGNICSTTTTEISECSATIAPGSSPVTITGTAQFFKRTIISQSGRFVLGGPISTALPIKFAEVRVVNSSGTVIQCGKTNALGALKAVNGTSNLQIPNTPGTYKVEVLSRSNHTMDVSGVPTKPAFQLYASVKKDICTNSLHTLSANITSDGTNATSPTLTAYARESETDSALEGGAFNIYNNLVATYTYLASNTGTTNISCLNPKLHVYWQAGFNPAQYIYPDEDPSTVPNISFYLRGSNELYINGGKIGNVTTEDTDHFDDAVVIHEIGHRIEDACGKMDSPGGAHNGLFRIDPRLAWSEGWGNFLGAHIIKNKIADINPDPALATLLGAPGWVYYLDTKGYKDGSNGTATELIRFDLTRAGNNPESYSSGGNTFYFDKVDPVANPGEGHFREVSIARSLFKITNTCATGCTNRDDYFDEIWKSVDKVTGLGQSIYPFRSSTRFYNRLNAIFVSSVGALPASIDATLNTDEAQQRHDNTSYTISGNLTWPAYGIKLMASNTPCNLEIRPRNEDIVTTDVLSDQRYSNHFYLIDKASLLTPTHITTIYLNASKLAGSTVDLDLILYQEGYQFVTDSSGAKTTASSQFVRSDRSSGLSKTIGTLDALGTQPYLLNIRAFTTGISVLNTTSYTYTLTTNNAGEYLCPSPTF